MGKLLLDDGVGGCQKNLDILYDVVFRKISLESHPFITPIMAQNEKKGFLRHICPNYCEKGE